VVVETGFANGDNHRIPQRSLNQYCYVGIPGRCLVRMHAGCSRQTVRLSYADGLLGCRCGIGDDYRVPYPGRIRALHDY